MTTDIFISYAKEDTSKAMELARLLEDDGWTVWWDREISPGQDFEIEIDMALARARAVVVLWSVFSVSSTWVRNEAKEAKEMNKLIPVRLDDSRIPLTYRSLNNIDLRQWPDKPSLVEISMFKSAVSRVLLDGVSDQMLKKPAAGDQMTLSVRVASRVAEMVAEGSSNHPGNANQEFQLSVERSITDICLYLLSTPPVSVDTRLDDHIMQLANAMQASTVIRNRVDFSRMNVSDIRNMGFSKVSPTQERAILEYVNQYCSPLGEHNLNLCEKTWPFSEMLCLPLSTDGGEREYVWFMSEPPSADWTQDIQQRLMNLATAFQASRNRG